MPTESFHVLHACRMSELCDLMLKVNHDDKTPEDLDENLVEMLQTMRQIATVAKVHMDEIRGRIADRIDATSPLFDLADKHSK